MDLGSDCLHIAQSALPAVPAVRRIARAAGQGEPERFPVKAAKKAKPARQGRAFWIERDIGGEAQVWLVRRAGKGMLGGMRALPDDGWTARADGSARAPLAGPDAGRARAKSSTSSPISPWNCACGLSRRPAGGRAEGEWWPLDRLDEAGLPTLFAKAARLALAARAGR